MMSSRFTADARAAFTSLPTGSCVITWSPPDAEGHPPLELLDALRTVTASTVELLASGVRCSLGLGALSPGSVGAWIEGLSDLANPLQILAELRNSLPPGSPVAWRRAHSGFCGTVHWERFWCRAAERLGYRVLVSEMQGTLLRTPTEPNAWSPGFAGAKDATQIRDLFSAVFGGSMSAEFYEWKYGATRGGSVVARVGDQVVAHCGAIPRRLLARGTPERAVQLTDVMVHPSYRGILRRRGVFYETTASAIEVFGPLAFGFPSMRHLKLGQRHDFYDPADKVVEMVWTVRDVRPRNRLQLLDLSRPADRSIALGLWREMAADLRDHVVGVRDPEWLIYRYDRHPHYRHFIYAVRSRLMGRHKGLIVARVEGDSLVVLDWIARLTDLPALVDDAIRIGSIHGAKRCTTWLSDRFASTLDRHDPLLIDPEISVPTIIWCRDGREHLLRGWWLSPGDSDFR